jgi:hypothetical protein
MTDTPNDALPGAPPPTEVRLVAVTEISIDPVDPADMRDIWCAVAQAAKGGDMHAAEVARRWWRSRQRRLRIDLAPIHDLAGVVRAQAELFALAAAGEITAREGRDFSALVENRRKAIETLEYEPLMHKLNELNADAERTRGRRR